MIWGYLVQHNLQFTMTNYFGNIIVKRGKHTDQIETIGPTVQTKNESSGGTDGNFACRGTGPSSVIS